jgi:hypothetical protein
MGDDQAEINDNFIYHLPHSQFINGFPYNLNLTQECKAGMKENQLFCKQFLFCLTVKSSGTTKLMFIY